MSDLLSPSSSLTPSLTSNDPPLVLFDGVCNLCSFAVNFIIDRDRKGALRFASLQSDVGQAAMARHGLVLPPGDPDSVVFLEGGRVYERSTAALRIARYLSGGWPLLYAFVAVPAFVRDAVYKWIARNRYRWFGKSDACRIPTPELRSRFLT